MSVLTLNASSPTVRATTTALPVDHLSSFIIGGKNRSYRQQYSNIYFMRLNALKQSVQAVAKEKWAYASDGENVQQIPRVLEIVKNQLCFVIGTVYMDMPLKPNVLEDIARDRSIPAPPALPKICSADDNVMLEDESGRITLVGDKIKNEQLVTGIIIGALGIETDNGDFEVVDICYPGYAPQAKDDDTNGMDVDDASKQDEWIGVVSGFDIGSSTSSEALMQLLIEYLNGEVGGNEDQLSASQISRLIIAGNSWAPLPSVDPSIDPDVTEDRKSKRYGHEATNFSPEPTNILNSHLLELARVIPIHILPGENDPSGAILPQQALPRGLFGAASQFESFACETNPTYLRIASNDYRVTRTFLVNSGQPLNDMFKYVMPPHSRIGLLSATLKWRHMAPTAPDTLWCHPYFADDPFLMKETPHIYIVSGQKRFMTKMVVDEEDPQRRCRIVMVPGFSNTGVLVLINLKSLAVKTITFGAIGMTGNGQDVRAATASSQDIVSEEPQSKGLESSQNESSQFDSQ